MKQKCKIKLSTYINLILIASIISVLLVLPTIPKANALGKSQEIQIQDLSTENNKITVYSNIKNYFDFEMKKFNGVMPLFKNFSKDSIRLKKAKEINKKVGYTDKEISNMSNEEILTILNCNQVICNETYIKTDVDGYQTLAPKDEMVTDEKDYKKVEKLFNSKKNIVTKTTNEKNVENNFSATACGFVGDDDWPKENQDVARNGYMSSKMMIKQDFYCDNDESLQIKDENDKWVDNPNYEFYGYGYNCEFTMKWLKVPFYRNKDQFIITWGGDANLYKGRFSVDYTCNKNVSNGGKGTTEFIKQKANVEWKSPKKAVAIIDLKNNLALPKCYTSYTYHTVKAKFQLISKQRKNNTGIFNIMMGYVHKQKAISGESGLKIDLNGIMPCITINNTWGFKLYSVAPQNIDTLIEEDREAHYR